MEVFACVCRSGAQAGGRAHKVCGYCFIRALQRRRFFGCCLNGSAEAGSIAAPQAGRDCLIAAELQVSQIGTTSSTLSSAAIRPQTFWSTVVAILQFADQ